MTPASVSCRAGVLSFIILYSPYMDFTFAAERKVVFTIQASGMRLLVEFSERNQSGVSSYFTSNPKVAEAIRKSSLSRRGVIIETTPNELLQQALSENTQAKTVPQRSLAQVKGVGASKPKAAALNLGASTAARKVADNAVKKAAMDAAASQQTSDDVREYENFSVAREKISKEFSIPKKDVRTPTALAKVAKEHGFTIRYKNAEQ